MKVMIDCTNTKLNIGIAPVAGSNSSKRETINHPTVQTSQLKRLKKSCDDFVYTPFLRSWTGYGYVWGHWR